MEREFAAQKVRNKLHEAEAATEAALRQTGELVGEMYAAKAAMGLAATVGDEETARVARALALLEQARQELVGSHRGLEAIGRALKLRTRAGVWKPNQAKLEPQLSGQDRSAA